MKKKMDIKKPIVINLPKRKSMAEIAEEIELKKKKKKKTK